MKTNVEPGRMLAIVLGFAFLFSALSTMNINLVDGQDINLETSCNTEPGRVVFDSSFLRVYSYNVWPHTSGHDQYIENVADWLQHGDATGVNILVYDTWQGGDGYGLDRFTPNADTVLTAHGSSVLLTDRSIIPSITASTLSAYDQLWIINGQANSQGVFSAGEIQTILDFNSNGNGLMLIADHDDKPSGWDIDWSTDVDQIAANFGVEFDTFVDQNYLMTVSEPDFDITHPIWDGVNEVWGGTDSAIISNSANINVVAAPTGPAMVATLDPTDSSGEVDISISNNDITLSEGNPVEGTNITIGATIHGDQSSESQWQKYGVVLDIGGWGQDERVGKASVLKLDNGTYVMYYQGNTGTGHNYRIFRAFSYDGIQWFKECMVLDNGGPYSSNGVMHPNVIINPDGTFQMWYAGYNYESGAYRARILHAVSSDGYNWQITGLALDFGSASDPDSVLCPSVIPRDDGGYEMWYTGMFWNIPGAQICHATLPANQAYWIKDGVVLNSNSSENHYAMYSNVIKTDSGYEMFYTAGHNNRIVHAISNDGMNWIRDNIVIEPTLPAEGTGVGCGGAMLDDGTYKLWYSGYTDTWRILYAEKTPSNFAHDATCTVSFYIDSISPENLIGSRENVFVPADGEVTVDMDWIAIAGTHTVLIQVSNVNPPDSDLSNNVASTSVFVNLANQSPVADTGPDQTANQEVPVQFDASGSYDPDGSIISYDWDFGDGAAGTGISPTHTYLDDGTYTATLTVTDDDGLVASDNSMVTVLNQAPIAIAGPDQTVVQGTVVQFDASGSYDPDGSIISYDWDFGDGAAGTGISPTHTYLDDGTYTATLTVTDDDGLVASDNCMVTVQNQVPIAIAGPDQTANQEVPVQFNASGSYDPDGTIVSYGWDFGDGATGTGLDPVHSYNIPGNYTVSLTVMDDDGATGTDMCQITVTEPEIPPEPALLTIDKVKTAGPDEVETFTCYGWALEITVENTGGSDALNVVVQDVLPAELGLVTYSATTGVLTAEQNGNGRMGSTALTWDIGTMAPGDSAVLDLIIATGQNPAGKQEFTSPGNYSLNDGAWLSGVDSLTGESLAAGPTPPITVTAIEVMMEEEINEPGTLPEENLESPPDAMIDMPAAVNDNSRNLESSDTAISTRPVITTDPVSDELAIPLASRENSFVPFSIMFVLISIGSLAAILHIKSVKNTNEAKIRELDRKLIRGEITETQYLEFQKP